MNRMMFLESLKWLKQWHVNQTQLWTCEASHSHWTWKRHKRLKECHPSNWSHCLLFRMLLQLAASRCCVSDSSFLHPPAFSSILNLCVCVVLNLFFSLGNIYWASFSLGQKGPLQVLVPGDPGPPPQLVEAQGWLLYFLATFAESGSHLAVV